MTFWESVKAFLRREASDVKDGFEDLKDRFDAELTKREAELEATPSERLEMIRDDIEQSDTVFDRIEDKIDSRLPRTVPAEKPPVHTQSRSASRK